MKSVVLLSAGLDSTVNLYAAIDRGFEVALVLTFDYGQKAATKEFEFSKKICSLLKLTHICLDLPFLKNLGNSSLTDASLEIPTHSVNINDSLANQNSAKSVWVPNRNGIFLNIAAAYAESLGADCVIPGFNAEEAATFPDNSYEYMIAATNSFSYSTRNRVQAYCFTHQMDKTQIVREAQRLNIPFELLWPCYFAGEKPCGKCESCQRSQRAFRANKISGVL